MMVPSKVAQYDIVEPIGEGGMGTVMKAHDRRLDRMVALKFLTPQVTANAERRERFQREARTASRLDHPNICTIYELGETDDGAWFIAMPYYQGESLADRLRRGPLSIAQTLDVARQLLEALRAAHDAGIVHRDIKPANVMLTEGGPVKLLDFGVAKLEGDVTLTAAGAVAGTPLYMSPEQARGSDADQRADLWSLGAVLYECLAGRPPFQGPHQAAVVLAILRERHPALRQERPEVPEPLAALIDWMLEKDPSLRCPTAAQALARLEQVRIDGTMPPTVAEPLTTRPAMPADTGRRLIVLPFADLSPEGDQAYFCDGLTDELIVALGRLPGLRVVSRTTAFQFRERNEDLRDIGVRLNVDTALEGTVRKAGKRLRITAQLCETANGYCVWSHTFDRELEDVFAIQDELAGTVADTLRIQLGPTAASDAKITHDIEAYQELLRGRYLAAQRTRTGILGAVEHCRHALELDATYATAHAELADALALAATYGLTEASATLAEAAAEARRAIELDPRQALAHAILGFVVATREWDWTGAEAHFTTALGLRGDDPAILQRFALYVLLPLGRFAEARERLKSALDIDPLAPVLRACLGLCEYFAGDPGAAERELQDALALDQNFALARYFRAEAYEASGRLADAERELRRAVELVPGSLEMTAALARVRGRLGNTDAAQEALTELEARADRETVPAYHLAQVRWGLGDLDGAERELLAALERREPSVIWLGVRPLLAELRERPAIASALPHRPA